MMTNTERAKALSDRLLEWGMQSETARVEAIEEALDEAEERGRQSEVLVCASCGLPYGHSPTCAMPSAPRVRR